MEPLKNAASKVFISPIKVLASEKSQPLNKVISGVAVALFTIASVGIYGVYAANFYKKRKIQQKSDLGGNVPMPNENIKEKKLINAVNQNDVKKAKVVLKAHPDLDINTIDGGKESLLGQAVARGQHEMAELLLQHAANPDQKLSNGETTLLETAIMKGDIKMVELLHKNGAKIGDMHAGVLLFNAAKLGYNKDEFKLSAHFPEIIDWLVNNANLDLNDAGMTISLELIKEELQNNPYGQAIYDALIEKGVK